MSHAVFTKIVAHVKDPVSAFRYRRPNGRWPRDTQRTHDSSRMIKIINVATNEKKKKKNLTRVY